jgi:hypothetical protein
LQSFTGTNSTLLLASICPAVSLRIVLSV